MRGRSVGLAGQPRMGIMSLVEGQRVYPERRAFWASRVRPEEDRVSG